MAGGWYFSTISSIAATSFFSPPKTTSRSFMSVEKLFRYISDPLDRLPRMSHVYVAHPIGPWTRWTASVTGFKTTRAPQKTQARWLTEPARLSSAQWMADLFFPPLAIESWRSLMQSSGPAFCAQQSSMVYLLI